jgi:hypothetical protein
MRSLSSILTLPFPQTGCDRATQKLPLTALRATQTDLNNDPQFGSAIFQQDPTPAPTPEPQSLGPIRNGITGYFFKTQKNRHFVIRSTAIVLPRSIMPLKFRQTQFRIDPVSRLLQCRQPCPRSLGHAKKTAGISLLDRFLDG